MNWLKILRKKLFDLLKYCLDLLKYCLDLLKFCLNLFKVCQLKISEYIIRKLNNKKLGPTATLERPLQPTVFLWIKRYLVDPLFRVYLILIKRPVVWIYVNFLKHVPARFYLFLEFIWREQFNIKNFLAYFLAYLIILLSFAICFSEATYICFFGFS